MGSTFNNQQYCQQLVFQLQNMHRVLRQYDHGPRYGPARGVSVTQPQAVLNAWQRLRDACRQLEEEVVRLMGLTDATPREDADEVD